MTPTGALVGRQQEAGQEVPERLQQAPPQARTFPGEGKTEGAAPDAPGPDQEHVYNRVAPADFCASCRANRLCVLTAVPA